MKIMPICKKNGICRLCKVYRICKICRKCQICSTCTICKICIFSNCTYHNKHSKPYRPNLTDQNKYYWSKYSRTGSVVPWQCFGCDRRCQNLWTLKTHMTSGPDQAGQTGGQVANDWGEINFKNRNSVVLPAIELCSITMNGNGATGYCMILHGITCYCLVMPYAGWYYIVLYGLT